MARRAAPERGSLRVARPVSQNCASGVSWSVLASCDAYLSLRDLEPQDLRGLSPRAAVTELAARMLQHIQHHANDLESKSHELELKNSSKLLERTSAPPCTT